ncbi:MAG: T9SS type A sorting domain-containing protein [Bacteroidetes bacterium]|jgi:glutathione peroxidase|nr:T9SS type A sorting domain-containing protein [Bacteroidota bacterium]MBT5529938.1 T9SS type A sorting domain-containing protein [Cytophagia bacterium]MBT3422169.1 T9SS type A sorting domain-containing protein [Bacteroidota bacterium]MBT3801671.1 T9SS type A sorting domain-containing protein [Bacteroidota bacterium]MBT3933411.1 T9SS type A sorting domain-containing protein [Bacteroidota bacterium]
MKKAISIYIFVLLSFLAFSQKTFHDFKVISINGDTVDLSIFKGQKIMVVNTASLCGYTYQYEELQQLFQDYKKHNFTIIGFPSNDFGNQEPGSDGDILKFCEDNYGVTFPMMAKIHVSGAQIHPLYQWLTKQTENGVKDAPVEWNFQKFLIDEDGSWHDVRLSATSPLAPIITTWIAQGTSLTEEECRVSNLTVYPAPATDHFNVVVTVEELSNVVVKIMNMNGQLVEELYNSPVENDLRISYNTDRMLAGLYVVIAEINQEKKSMQIRIDK